MNSIEDTNPYISKELERVFEETETYSSEYVDIDDVICQIEEDIIIKTNEYNQTRQIISELQKKQSLLDGDLPSEASANENLEKKIDELVDYNDHIDNSINDLNDYLQEARNYFELMSRYHDEMRVQ